MKRCPVITYSVLSDSGQPQPMALCVIHAAEESRVRTIIQVLQGEHWSSCIRCSTSK